MKYHTYFTDEKCGFKTLDEFDAIIVTLVVFHSNALALVTKSEIDITILLITTI